MRNAFAAQMKELADNDPRVVLLSGDIGNRLFDKYKENHANKFHNCGVAEANMTGVAAGMAMSGLRPFTYTITPFNTTRCLEQIRVDVCYHNLPVVIVGVGAGLSYASLGATHHSCEDISLLRSLPNMHVVCPGDAVEVKLALKAALELGKPVYIRIGKKNEPVIHKTEPTFEIGKAIKIKDGEDICLLSTGNTLPLTLAAAEIIEQKGGSVKVYSMHTVKPLDEKLLKDVFADCKIVATVEEHSLIGGLSSAVAEFFLGDKVNAQHMRFSTPDDFIHASGSQENAREMVGLTADNIAKSILAEM
jgi:transketolase